MDDFFPTVNKYMNNLLRCVLLILFCVCAFVLYLVLLMLLASLDCVADVASVSRLSILDYACVFLYHSKLLCRLVEIKYYKLSSC